MAHRKKSLGRLATFLIPENKNSLVQEEITHFLTDNFDGFSISGPIIGYYLKKFDGRYRRYEVGFVGKERIPMLDDFIEMISRKIDEACIIVTTGEDAYLIYPI